MAELLKPACELGKCSYFRLSEMDEETKRYIFEKCKESLELRLKADATFDESQCPQAALTAAVITNLAIREGEFGIIEEQEKNT